MIFWIWISPIKPDGEARKKDPLVTRIYLLVHYNLPILLKGPEQDALKILISHTQAGVKSVVIVE